MVTLFQLNSFCTVADEGSFSAAAEKMYISQPSVSQHIASLEEHFGVQLFNRRKRRIRLTPEGRLLYTAAREILGRLNEVTERMESLRSLETGALNVGYTPGMDTGPVAGVFSEYARAFPGVRLRLVCANTSGLVDRLRNGDLELALAERNLQSPAETDISSHVIGIQRLVFVAPAETPLPEESLSPGDLQVMPFVFWSEDAPFSAYLEDFSLRHQIRLDVRARAATPMAVIRLVADGIGVGLVPEASAADGIESGYLRLLPFDYDRPITIETLALFHHIQGLTYAGWEMLRLLEKRLGDSVGTPRTFTTKNSP
ncbi:MAG: LysR family transcriptional regulator [Thermovirgaceae bacterium]